MSDDSRADWNQRYQQTISAQHPARVLTDHLYLLPSTGKALDLACGLGANALLLVRQGLATWAWDSSEVAIARLNAAARAAGLSIHSEVRDVVADPPAPERFAVIVVSHFLERSLAPALQAALRPGGLLFYQTFTKTRVTQAGPKNPAFLLDENELLRLFAGLKVIFYREEGEIGDTQRGFRDEAMLIAQKRKAP